MSERLRARQLVKWERLCRQLGLAPIAKVPTRHGDVYIAEGFRPPAANPRNDAERQSHFEMAWMIGRNGLDVGKPLKVGAVDWPLQSQRIEIAMRDARQWIQDNLDIGRYAG